MKKMQETSN